MASVVSVCISERKGAQKHQVSEIQLPKHLGMIGSKRRVEGLLNLLAEEGFDPEALARIHAPIGLKINAQTPLAQKIAPEVTVRLRCLS